MYSYVAWKSESSSAMAINSDDEDALEEERRLCYVGITRAMKKLYLSCARNRMLHGSRNCNDISRFIKEIPPLLFQDSGDITRHVKRMEERQFADTGYTGNRYGSSGQSGYGKGSYHGNRRKQVPDILHRIHTAATVRQRKSRSV